MSEQKLNLKFIHLASNTAATNNTANAGAIIFEPKSGRIAVQGNSGLEYYGGGRIADAKFENSILTLSFNNGDKDIVLDFSDVASTSGMNKILGALRTDVNALADKVGDDSKGLVKAVADNKTAIDAINNPTTGILAEAKKYADGKVNGKFDTVGSAAQALKDAKAYTDGKVGDIGDGNVKDYVDTAKGAAIEAAKTYTNTEIGKVNSAAEALGDRVEALETTVGNEGSGLVKKVNDNATAITALQGLHKDKTGGKMSVEEEVTAGVNAKVGDIKIDGAAVTVKAYVDAGDAKALNDAKSYTNTKVETINSNAEALKGRVDTLETTVNDENTGLVKKVDTLIGTDANKSVRTIANEELAAQLIPEGAKESLDTLQEIAAWIQSHPDDASAMANDIKALKTTVGDASNGLVKDVATNAGKIATNATNIGTNTGNITKLQGLHAAGTHDGYSTVAEEVAAGIKVLGVHSESNVAGSDVVVTVTTTEGKVSAVAVDASGLRNDLGVKAADAGTDTAFARIKALETTVGDSNSGLVKAVATNTSNINANADAIKALQDAQASGALMWFDWQD